MKHFSSEEKLINSLSHKTPLRDTVELSSYHYLHLLQTTYGEGTKFCLPSQAWRNTFLPVFPGIHTDSCLHLKKKTNPF